MKRSHIEHHEVQILSTGMGLDGFITIPAGAQGIVVFVHGSGRSRHSSRNQYVAGMLQEARLGTVLFDLLTPEEEEIDRHTRHLRFDIDLLARRTIGALEWLALQAYAGGLRHGLFGASTGAAAALIAAARVPGAVHAVVSRGGRPDLAGRALSEVEVPTLLIVGAEDQIVLRLNKEALSKMPPRPQKTLSIVPGASHLFEEPGALEEAARLAREWFERFLLPVEAR